MLQHYRTSQGMRFFPQSLHVNVSPPTRAVWGLPLCESSFCKEPTPCAPASSACCLSSWQSFPIPKRSHQKRSNRNPYPILFFKSPCAFAALFTVTKNPLETCFFFHDFLDVDFSDQKSHPLRPPTTLMDRCASYAKQLNPWRLEAQNLQQNPGWFVVHIGFFYLSLGNDL